MNIKKRHDADLVGDKSTRVFTAMSNLMGDAYREIERCCHQSCEITGITTGFKNMDSGSDGFHRGELIVIGGRVSMGKTALAINLATNAAKSDRNYSVAMLSLSMNTDQISQRVLAMSTGIELYRLYRGQLTAKDWQLLVIAVSELDECQLILSGATDSLADMESIQARLNDEAEKLDLLVIDDLQSLAEHIGIKQSMQGIVGIMQALKTMAKALNIAVVVTSHIKSTVESRAEKRPRISDLYNAAAIERTADVIMLLYRHELYNPKPSNEGLAEIMIAKQSHGELERLQFTYEGKFSRFSETEWRFENNELSSWDRTELHQVYDEMNQAMFEEAIKHPYTDDVDTSLHPDD
ncbi:MAG: DnaB-like helicase C-terminal domain-containing protein [Mariprofundus sp.]